ncbi:MAG: alpha/beta hydrolase family protein [Kiloniellaceae bacterium]
MRIALAIIATLCLAASPAGAAGIQQITLPDTEGAIALEGAVWTPCAAAPETVTLRRLPLPGTANCPVVGEDLPLVVISHGARGWFGGHQDTAAALADAGFVVAAITHPDAPGRAWRAERPAAIKRLVDFMLENWADHERLDGRRIGFFGFSRGGYTGLVLIGGTPDFRLAGRHCQEVPDDPICRVGPDAGPPPGSAPAPAGPFTQDPRIGAAVIAAPLGLVFSPEGLQGVSVPVQLWRPENDALARHPYNAEAVYQGLPQKPEYHVVAGAGHFAILAPCLPPQAARAPAICKDAPGFDRTAFHRAFNADILAFFRRHLGVQ